MLYFTIAKFNCIDNNNIKIKSYHKAIRLPSKLEITHALILVDDKKKTVCMKVSIKRIKAAMVEALLQGVRK